MTVSRVYAYHIYSNTNESLHPIENIRCDTQGRTDSQPSVGIFTTVGKILHFHDILKSNEPFQGHVGRDHRKLFNLVLLQNGFCLLKSGSCWCSHKFF